MKLNNKYYLLRHGQAISNVKGICSSWPETFNNPLTEVGRKKIGKAAQQLKNKSISIIFSSDVLRAKQTSEIIGESLKIEPKFDRRLREIDFGTFNGKSKEDFDRYFKSEKERLVKSTPGGEDYEQVSKRVMEFLKDVDIQYRGKIILIVSHECPLWLLKVNVDGVSLPDILENLSYEEKIENGVPKELN
jgi:broad specificity phosphatase PhoE